jgi:tRNA1(Val) A37 N6-methylase TrmN6
MPETKPAVATTLDSFLDGAVTLRQPASRRAHYRANVDSVHLARFAARFPAREACDLGAGTGLVGLALLHLRAATRVSCVERDPIARALLEENYQRNGHTPLLIGNDVREVLADPRYGLVVCNPPYYAAGRTSAAHERSQARFGSLDPFLHATTRLLGRRGRLALCYPAHGLTELLLSLRACRLEPKTMQAVAPARGHAPRIFLVQAQRAKAGLTCLPEVYDHPYGLPTRA